MTSWCPGFHINSHVVHFGRVCYSCEKRWWGQKTLRLPERKDVLNVSGTEIWEEITVVAAIIEQDLEIIILIFEKSKVKQRDKNNCCSIML